MLEEGQKAPDFKLPDANGETVQLSKLKGQTVVLYFYPKDDTSGCTTQAQDFSAAIQEFKDLGAHVLGMSPDSAAKHQKFRDKYDLAVQLIADEEKTALEAYGVWVEKSMYGKKYMGVERSTVLIDKAGKIRRVWRKVKVKGHVAEVLDAVREL